MGKPVIVCDDKGAYEYIENGKEGIITPAGDSGALKKAIQQIINNEIDIEEMTKRAREKAGKFTVDNTMGRVLALAEEITGKKVK